MNKEEILKLAEKYMRNRNVSIVLPGELEEKMYVMTENEILDLAEKYLENRKTKYVRPGTLGKCEDNKIEVIFLKPEALDPDVVIVPSDVRVLVDKKTKEVTWTLQM